MTWEVIEAAAPVHWACYLIYGDASGLEDVDIAAADAFVDRIGCGAPVSMAEDEEGSRGFCHHWTVAILCPEAPALGCDMTDYHFLKEA